MVPSLDDIQQSINRMIQLTLDVSRGVAHWGQRHLQKPSTSPEGNLSPSQIGGKSAKKDESEITACFTFLNFTNVTACKFQPYTLKLYLARKNAFLGVT